MDTSLIDVVRYSKNQSKGVPKQIFPEVYQVSQTHLLPIKKQSHMKYISLDVALG